MELQERRQSFGALLPGRLDGQFQTHTFDCDLLKSTSSDGAAAFVGANRVSAQVTWQLVARITDPEVRLRQVVGTVIEAGHPMLDPCRISDGFCGQMEGRTE